MGKDARRILGQKGKNVWKRGETMVFVNIKAFTIFTLNCRNMNWNTPSRLWMFMLSSAVNSLMIELFHHWLRQYKKHIVLLKTSLQSGITESFDKAVQFFQVLVHL